MNNFPCRKSICQEYGCYVNSKPFFSDKHICYDKCLADELFYLWDLGIVTTGCCCGHHEGMNGECSNIGVEERFIPKMKALGYKVLPPTKYLKKVGREDEGREDIFISKTIFN